MCLIWLKTFYAFRSSPSLLTLFSSCILFLFLVLFGPIRNLILWSQLYVIVVPPVFTCQKKKLFSPIFLLEEPISFCHWPSGISRLSPKRTVSFCTSVISHQVCPSVSSFYVYEKVRKLHFSWSKMYIKKFVSLSCLAVCLPSLLGIGSLKILLMDF